jgi:hypothetical protein
MQLTILTLKLSNETCQAEVSEKSYTGDDGGFRAIVANLGLKVQVLKTGLYHEKKDTRPSSNRRG